MLAKTPPFVSRKIFLDFLMSQNIFKKITFVLSKKKSFSLIFFYIFHSLKEIFLLAIISIVLNIRKLKNIIMEHIFWWNKWRLSLYVERTIVENYSCFCFFYRLHHFLIENYFIITFFYLTVYQKLIVVEGLKFWGISKFRFMIRMIWFRYRIMSCWYNFIFFKI